MTYFKFKFCKINNINGNFIFMIIFTRSNKIIYTIIIKILFYINFI